MGDTFSWDQVLANEGVKNQAKKEGLATNPVTGEPILHVEPGAPEMPAREGLEAHYRPAYVPKDVHSIRVDDGRDDQREVATANTFFASEEVLPLEDVHLDEILRLAIERRASDIHITTGLPPMIRLDGELTPLPYAVVTANDARRLIYDCLSDEHIQQFEQTHELDFGYGVRGLARFRFNVYMQRGSVAAALRVIPTKIPSFEQLGLPPVIREISKRTSGLILVTGPTGSGKSTTIASMIDDINETRTSHIMTIEDPIEYLHSHKRCMVNQRELHADTYSFKNALRAVLREDPDIILVGEMRDQETAEIGMRAAMTGHLVLSTLHTNDALSTPIRLLDMGVPNYMVAMSIQLVLAQRLVRTICPNCSAPHEPEPHEREWLRYELGERVDAYRYLRGVGCVHCGNSGYQGRQAVYEFLEMTNALVEAANHGDPADFMRLGRQQMAGETLRRNAVRLVTEGRTTIEEAMRVATQLDE